MRSITLAFLAAGLAACTQTVSDNAVPLATTPAAGEDYDMRRSYDSLAVIEMKPDTSFLSVEERQVVNLLNQASNYMTEIYLRQRYAANPQVREAIERTRRVDRDLLLEMFNRNLGP